MKYHTMGTTKYIKVSLQRKQSTSQFKEAHSAFTRKMSIGQLLVGLIFFIKNFDGSDLLSQIRELNL